ncbi:MAG TPA: zinc ribbon domain-containing protein [Symbiobacteriaceae bacterium]|nr:zinc ribbon domain-containing protein [Symbiobacteriaceae bacterium]
MTMRKVLLAVALVAAVFLGLAVLETYQNARQWLPDREYEEKVLDVIESEGIDVALYRHVLTVRPSRLDVCVVRRDYSMDMYEYCNLPGYAGFPRNARRPGQFQSGLIFTETSRTVTAPDGREFYLLMWYRGFDKFTAWFDLALAVAVVSLWVCLALWVFHDAKVRRSKARVGWLLLTLMTGPVGLAVWLVVRTDPSKKPVCPGCGADAVSGTMFCVRCGHPLYPSCPECGRRVESDWAYCGTCGASLEDSGGDKHGLLAHEDGA